MLCVRCKMAVKQVLEGLNISYQSIQIGKIQIAQQLTTAQLNNLSKGLQFYQLEILDNKKKILANQVKSVIIELFAPPYKKNRLTFSDYLSGQLHYDYTYLANNFSETEGNTIEKYYISYRIERVKELMAYESLTIKEISHQLHFSSVSHLTQQFKKITGMTPAAFRKLLATDEFQWRVV